MPCLVVETATCKAVCETPEDKEVSEHLVPGHVNETTSVTTGDQISLDDKVNGAGSKKLGDNFVDDDSEGHSGCTSRFSSLTHIVAARHGESIEGG